MRYNFIFAELHNSINPRRLAREDRERLNYRALGKGKLQFRGDPPRAKRSGARRAEFKCAHGGDKKYRLGCRERCGELYVYVRMCVCARAVI